MPDSTIQRPYRWVILFACVLVSAAGTGLLLFTAPLFVAPVTQALGVSRAAFMTSSTFSTLTTMLCMPLVGMLYKKSSMKIFLLTGCALGAAGYFIYSLSSTLAGFYCGAVLVGLGGCLMGGIPIALLLTNWFTQNRGLATGIAFAGSGIASALLSPVISRIIAQSGYAAGYRFVMAAIILLMVPTVLFLVRVRPEAAQDLSPAGAAAHPEQSEPTQRATFQNPAFWIYAFGIFVMGLAILGTQTQLVVYWTDLGNTPELAATMYSVVMFVAIFAKILLGSLFDHAGVPVAAAVCALASMLAMILLTVFTSGFVLLIPAMLFGITSAVQVIVPAYLTNRFFGDRNYATNFGVITTVLYLGISIGNPTSAFIFDKTGSYQPAWYLYAALMLIFLICVLLCNRSMQRQAH